MTANFKHFIIFRISQRGIVSVYSEDFFNRNFSVAVIKITKNIVSP